MKKSFHKIYEILKPEEKRSLVFISFLLFIGMVLEIFGLGIVFPFIISLLNPEKLTEIQFLNELIIFFGVSPDKDFTIIFLSLLVIVYFVKTIFMIYLAYKQNEFISKLTANLSNRLYNTYLGQPLAFHTKNNSSSLIKNIQIEVAYVKSFCMAFISIAIELSLAISIFLTLIFVETFGALFVAIYFVFLSIIYFQIVKPVLAIWGKERESTVRKISKTLVEGLSAIRELILFDAVESYINSFQDSNNKLISINTKNGTLGQVPRLLLELFAVIGIIIFIFFLLYEGQNNTYIISTIGVFIAATFRLIPSVNRILKAFQGIKFYTPSIDLIHDEICNMTLYTNSIASKEKFKFQSKIEIASESSIAIEIKAMQNDLT